MAVDISESQPFKLQRIFTGFWRNKGLNFILGLQFYRAGFDSSHWWMKGWQELLHSINTEVILSSYIPEGLILRGLKHLDIYGPKCTAGTASTAFMQLSFRLCSDVNIKITNTFNWKTKQANHFSLLILYLGGRWALLWIFLGVGKVV